jgi:hypothetical protein
VAKSAKQEVLAGIKGYQRATRKLRGLLDGVDFGLDILTSALRDGDSAISVLLRTDASSSRQEFMQTMDDFETSRRTLRVAILRLGQEQGNGVAELAKALGISRQLAYRILGEQ